MRMPQVIIGHGTTSVILLLILPFQFTIADKAADNSVPHHNPTEDNYRATTLSPRMVLLFSKALHKIVERRCPKVDDLELDTFQAHLNRQILSGQGRALRHPLNFNLLYQNLTGCADFVWSNGHPQDGALATNRHKSIGDTYGHGDREVKKPKPPLIPTPTHGESRKPNKPEEGARTSGNNKENPAEVTPTPTVFDKLAHNASTMAQNIFHSTIDTFKHLYSQTTRLFHNWFGRRKRDTFGGDVAYYAKTPLPAPPPHGSFSSKLKNTQSHFARVLKYFVEIAMKQCPKEFRIGKDNLARICELMVVDLSRDLLLLEQNGMYLRVNENLERQVYECAA